MAIYATSPSSCVFCCFSYVCDGRERKVHDAAVHSSRLEGDADRVLGSTQADLSARGEGMKLRYKVRGKKKKTQE